LRPVGSCHSNNEHAVHFYDRDDTLVEAVREFLVSGLEAGGPCIVIATEEHRRAFCLALAKHGIDVELARASGQLTLVDARETLDTIVVNGALDTEAFRRGATSLLNRAVAQGRHGLIHLYGEMVDLLWGAGNRSGAIELERLWNALAREYELSVLCGYVLGNFAKSTHTEEFERICRLHSHIVDENVSAATPGEGIVELALLRQRAASLEHEALQRSELERTLHQALGNQDFAEAALRENRRLLETITDEIPVLVSYVGTDGRYRFTNRAYERWFGQPSSTIVGKTMAEVLGSEAYERARPHVESVLSGKTVSYEARLPYQHGGTRFIEATYVPDFSADGKIQGFAALVSDISDRKRLEAARDAHYDRTERLMKITAAIAEAVTEEQVLDAVVDQTAAALGASTVGLWTTDQDGRKALLLRCFGYPDGARTRFSEVPLDATARFPALDVICTAKPIFISSQAELLERYPHLATAVTKGRSYSVACLPIAVEGSRAGSLVFTFDDAPPIDEDERKVLMLVARYSGQALARLHLLEADRRSRSQAEESAARAGLLSGRAEPLHDLAKAIIMAERVEPVLDAALDAIERALDTDRASILVFDASGVMRFKAWRGLSEGYRKAVEGHSPWSRDERAPEPIVVADVAADTELASYRPLFQREGIGSLAFIPLVASGRLVGKFMVYYAEPRELRQQELATARAIANHVAAALARFAAVDELRETVHFNEIFTGILGHDLRNPLGAIMTAAEVALKRDESERLAKPLSRIVTSGARMARMIDQLLDFTRVRVGAGIPIAPRPLDLAGVVRQVMDELDDTHPHCNLHFEHEGDTNGVWDADRLSQVFSNLVANAVQHGEREHGVRVSVDGTDRAEVRVTVRNAGKIPPEVLPKVFEPMTGAAPRRENSQGLGLGLFISQQILKAHGGRIDVRSTDTETTFTVCLPRVAKSPTNGTS
jgi:PAS domain S-box-containing protein